MTRRQRARRTGSNRKSRKGTRPRRPTRPAPSCVSNRSRTSWGAGATGASSPSTSGCAKRTGTWSSSTSITSGPGTRTLRASSSRRTRTSATPPRTLTPTGHVNTGNEMDEGDLPIVARSYLYLSGTPFRALNSGKFIEEQIYNWTYSDVQSAKET